ncbi:HlyD family type I secretion periplasmic adaptor subunit [Pseudomonas capsici]|uniref:HlyD family type I secretion periplasmic adaptor subunit n=1 Tax=Pseudomonas capsici TaxID=2810614 RepID=UPI0021F1CDA6|nr:HlyD family type I secretion periplasmic adaptor subunit [Pseudomonas capsici]MCV4282060.1 HlyD family type I secretion periplasmic adaptor subunit [Pseudomonas capsici]
MPHTQTNKVDDFTDLPISDHKIRYLGYGILIIVFGVFGTWSAIAPLDGAVHAPGVVTVQTYRKTVQHLEGGIVKEILVRDGDIVKKGTPLIVLDDAQLRAEYDMINNQLIASKATEARLIAERDNLSQITFSTMIDTSSQRGIEARDSETQVFNARRSARTGQTLVLQERISQLNAQIQGTESIIKTKDSLEKSYTHEIAELNELLSQGFVDKQRLLEQERKLDILKSEVAEHRSSIIKTRLQINETQLQILQINKEFNSEVTKNLTDTQTKNYDLEEKSAALADRLKRIIIRSPDDGMVIGMTVHTVGGVIRQATPLLDVVPSVSDLIVEAQVATNDINRIAIGKFADIRFSAFNNATTPVIQGVVTSISADRLTDEKNGLPYYLIKTNVTPEGLKKLGDKKLLSGMPAEILINSGERTLLQYLLQPARDAIAESMIEE